ncbi:pyruvate formate lyase family protein [Oscillibacter sp.]|uniref:glycyl radical protein n=1 Tax=Oscillibacter sp. TaxID=1945593 RepID=UPI0026285881|nr:pyruvate formate lyase family protein [Oscillibacter sp.]MDD3347850.1 pyruvate formate lyase family protein [Oscillibacter sp.]
MSERVTYLRLKAAAATSYVCGERGRIVTDSYRSTEGEAPVIRRAIALRDILNQMSIVIDENELIVGNHATRENAAPLFPEFSIDFLVNELDEFEKRPYDRFYVTDETKTLIREIAPYWRGRTHEDRVVRTTERMFPEEILKGWDANAFRLNDVLYDGVRKSAGDGHIVPDYFKMMAGGIPGVLREAEEARAGLNLREDPHAFEKKLFLDAVTISYSAVEQWFLRFAEKAEEMVFTAKKENQATLKRAADACRHLAGSAPSNFFEALQLTYFLHLLIHIESNGHSISLGRIDQYLYPFYERDVRCGAITPETALEMIDCFYIKVSRFNKVRPWPETRLKSGAPMFMTITLGGMDRQGKECSNKLTELFLDVLKETRLPQPTPILRVNQDTPEALIVHAVEALVKHGGGLPAFFSDEAIIAALVKTGVPVEDAREYAIGGCSEAVVPGKSFSFTGGDCYFNFLKILEIMLHEGVNPRTGMKLFETKKLEEYHSIEDVMAEFHRQLALYMSYIVELTAITSATDAALNPTPYTSGLLDYRIEMGCDMSMGGGKNAPYSHTILQGHGTGDTCNALYALQKLVFDEKELTLREFTKILDDNWGGERGEEVQTLARRLAKYGNDVDEVDAYAVRLGNLFAEEAQQYTPWRGGVFGTSLQGLTANVPEGETVGATPDGRCAHEALSDNISPHAGTDTHGPTATLKSVSKVDHTRFIDGNIVNLRFHPSALTDAYGRFDHLRGTRFADMIKSYLVDLKGNQVQFNILSAEEMRLAQQQPEAYRDLVVKVAGYSAYFNSLDKGLQDQIIERTEHSL